MRKFLPALLSLLILLGAVAGAFSPGLRGSMAVMAGENSLYGFMSYVGLLVLATVCMPVSVLPLIPVVSMVFGPFVTGLLSLIGWTLGAGIAFLIARHLGRPVLASFISLEKLDLMSRKLDGRTTFLSIVLLRLALPVDLASYALGLVKTISFRTYIAATIIGATWFSFSFAYLGAAILNGEVMASFILGTVSAFLFLTAWYMLAKRSR